MLFLSVLSFQKNGKRSRTFEVRSSGWKEVFKGASKGPFAVRKERKSFLERTGEGEGKKFFFIVRSLKMLSNVSIRLRVSPRVVKMIMSFHPLVFVRPGFQF